MKTSEYFLVCLIEELAELQQSVSKMIRFTINHQYEDYDKTNLQNFQSEFNDVLATLNILMSISDINIKVNSEEINKAVTRKIEMLRKSIELGVVDNGNSTN